MGNAGCCSEAFSAARAGATETNTDAQPLVDPKDQKNTKIIDKLESSLEKADDKIKVLNKKCSEQTEKITDMESELIDAKAAMQQNEQQVNELETELSQAKQMNGEKTEIIAELNEELALVNSGSYSEKQSSRIKKLEMKLRETKANSTQQADAQNKTIAQLAKQLTKLRNQKYKLSAMKNKEEKQDAYDENDNMILSDYSSMDEENKYDEDVDDLQKILFAEEYTVIFSRKPFGFTFGTNKRLYKDMKNLFVKHVDRSGIAAKRALIIGSKLVAFNDERVEDLGGKKIQKLFQSKYYNRDVSADSPMRITFKKPIFANSHFQRIYELESELETVNKQVKKLEKKLHISNKTISDLEMQLSHTQSGGNQQFSQIEKLTLELSIYKKKDESQSEKMYTLESSLREAMNRIRLLESDQNDKMHEVQKYKRELSEIKRVNFSEKRRLAELQTLSKEANLSLSELENKNTALMDAIEELKTNLREQKVTEEQKKYVSSKMAFIQGANVQQTREVRKLERQLKMAQNQIAARDGKIDDESQTVIRVQKQRINDLNRDLTAARVRIDELETKNTEMARHIRKLDSVATAAKRDKHIIYVEKNADYAAAYNQENEMKNEEYFESEAKQQSQLSYGVAAVGLQVDDVEKSNKKYSAQVEQQVCDWINDVVNDKKFACVAGDKHTFHQSLKNGVLLCKLVNILKPKSVKKQILKSKVGQSGAMAAFADKQRINEYSRVVKEMGFEIEYTFEAEDLWDAKNMTAVLYGLYAFGSFCRRQNIKNSKGGI